jgi:hypothetical protein
MRSSRASRRNSSPQPTAYERGRPDLTPPVGSTVLFFALATPHPVGQEGAPDSGYAADHRRENRRRDDLSHQRRALDSTAPARHEWRADQSTDEGVLEEEGRPAAQVTRFQAIAPTNTAKIVRRSSTPWSTIPDEIVAATLIERNAPAKFRSACRESHW